LIHPLLVVVDLSQIGWCRRDLCVCVDVRRELFEQRTLVRIIDAIGGHRELRDGDDQLGLCEKLVFEAPTLAPKRLPSRARRSKG